MRAVFFFSSRSMSLFCKSLMTIYRLYRERHLARLLGSTSELGKSVRAGSKIAGQKSGRLPGNSSLYDGAKISVECFDVRSGREKRCWRI